MDTSSTTFRMGGGSGSSPCTGGRTALSSAPPQERKYGTEGAGWEGGWVGGGGGGTHGTAETGQLLGNRALAVSEALLPGRGLRPPPRGLAGSRQGEGHCPFTGRHSHARPCGCLSYLLVASPSGRLTSGALVKGRLVAEAKDQGTNPTPTDTSAAVSHHPYRPTTLPDRHSSLSPCLLRWCLCSDTSPSSGENTCSSCR